MYRFAPGVRLSVALALLITFALSIAGPLPLSASSPGTLDSEVASEGEVTSSSDAAAVETASEVLALGMISDEVSGPDRYGTAVAASRRAFPSGASTVIIATGLDFPDSIGGAALASAKGGPILLTQVDAIPSSVMQEIERLGARNAIVLGNEKAVGQAVAGALRNVLGSDNVTRIGGTDRYATANLIARETVKALGPQYDGTAFIATGTNFPDALAASPIAAAKGWPILLAPTKGLTTATAHTLSDIGVKRVRVLGSNQVVSTTTYDQLVRTYGSSNVRRLGGSDRYETAVAVAGLGVEVGLGWDGLAISTGTTFPDALAGGVMQGRAGAVLLLTHPKSLSEPTAQALYTRKDEIRQLTYLGSTAAVSIAVRDQVAMGQPTNGRWLGAWVPGAPSNLGPLVDLEEKIGRKMGVSHYFQATGEGFTLAQARNAAKHGAIPLVTLEFWEPGKGVTQPSHNLKAIRDGSWDSYLRKYARDAKAYGGVVWLRPLHEMNGNWYPWSGTVNGNAPSDFVPAWRRIHSIFRAEGATNVRFVWSPNSESIPNTSANAIARYWPGDDYVDYVALDGYNWGTSTSWSRWRSFGEVFGPSYRTVIGLTNKPIFIGETATTHAGGDKVAWISDMFTSIPAQYPRIRGVVWFNQNKEQDWRIESSSSSLSAFKKGAANF